MKRWILTSIGLLALVPCSFARPADDKGKDEDRLKTRER